MTAGLGAFKVHGFRWCAAEVKRLSGFDTKRKSLSRYPTTSYSCNSNDHGSFEQSR
jgi:hypothetical protein